MSNNLNKAAAYKKIERDFYAAVEILNNRNLAFGEPAVVPYYHPNADYEDREIRLAIGYGSLNGEVEIVSTANDASTDVYRLQKEIDQINETISKIAEATSSITLSVKPDVIFANTPTEITLTSKVETIGEIGEHAINIDEVPVLTETGEQTITYTGSVDASSNITVSSNCEIDDFNITFSKTLEVVNPIYYGAGQTYEDITTHADPKKDPYGVYTINIENDGDYIFIITPSYMNVHIARMSGLLFPLKDPQDVEIDGVAYKSYQSVYTYQASTITIIVN